MSKGRKTKLDELQQARCRDIMQRDGQGKTAKRWNIDEVALLRAVTGYNIQWGTRSLIEQGLQKEGQ